MTNVAESAIMRFRKGQRVRLSPVGVARNLRLGATGTGIIVGFGRNEQLVRVVPTGLKPSSVRTIHIEFVEPQEPAA